MLVIEKEVKSCLFSVKILDLFSFLLCMHAYCLGVFYKLSDMEGKMY